MLPRASLLKKRNTMYNKIAKRILLLSTIAAALSSDVKAQDVDSIYLHNGQVIGAKVIKLGETTVAFTYIDEDAQQTLGNYAVQKILFGKSKRVQAISDKIDIKSKEDWEKVIIIEKTEEVFGMKRVGELTGKTKQINLRTGEGSDKTALKNLKMSAAENKCPFVFITTDKDIDRKSDEGGSWGQLQSIKKGIGYSYN
jgi:hypothetical protein